MKTGLMLMLFMAFYGCSGHVEKEIVIDPNKYRYSVHLGAGVWLLVPDGYKKAASYDGYQANNSESSISVKTSDKSSEELKKAYDPKLLRKRDMELIELSEVKYGEKGTGFFSVVHDKKNKLLRYFLSISKDGRTYNITSFCAEGAKGTYDRLIRWSLKNVFIGESKEEEELFKFAKLISSNEVAYSKDGKYPTESADNALAEWKDMSASDLDGALGSTLVEIELGKLVKKSRHMVEFAPLTNGMYYHGKAVSKNRKAYVALFVNEKKEGILVKCYGNEKSDLAEFERYVEGQLLKTVVRGY